MPTQSELSITIPEIDITSFLLDNIPDNAAHCENTLFTKPFLFSSENPDQTNLSLVDFKALVKCFAAGLKRAGLKQGEHVMLITPNYIYAIVVCLGVIAAGGVFCSSQPDFKPREYVDQLRRDGPAFVLVCDEEPLRTNALQALRDVKGSLDNVWLFDERLEIGKDENPEAGNSKDLRHWTGLLDWKTGPDYRWERLRGQDCRRPCQLFYTSGTSGLRKAGVVTHYNLVAAFTGVGHRVQSDVGLFLSRMGLTEHDRPVTRILHTISVARGFGTSLPLSTVRSRQKAPLEVFFMSKTWTNMSYYRKRIEELRITELSVAPFTLSRLLDISSRDRPLSGVEELNFSSVRSVTVTGAPCSQRTIEASRSFLVANKASPKVRIERAYAVTEAGSIVSHWRLCDAPDGREGCQGRLEPNFEAKIVSTTNSSDELQPGEQGELCLKSPTCISEYYGNDEATAEAFTKDGWYRTGDMGYLKDGKLFLFDRVKDSLKTPDNIPPQYVEEVLMEHPEIHDAGVVGIYKPLQEFQIIRAYLVKRPGSSITGKEMEAWMERESAKTAHLTGGVAFVDQLPRNSMGKMLRTELRERAKAELGLPSLASMNLAQTNGIAGAFLEIDEESMPDIVTAIEASTGEA